MVNALVRMGPRAWTLPSFLPATKHLLPAPLAAGGRAEVHHTVLLNITLSAELGWLPDTIKVEPGGQLLLHRVDVYVSSCAALEGFRKELCISEDNRGPPLYVEVG